MSDRYWLTDEQMARLQAYFPKSHGKPWVDGGRLLGGIKFINRNGLRWRDAPRRSRGLHRAANELIDDLVVSIPSNSAVRR